MTKPKQDAPAPQPVSKDEAALVKGGFGPISTSPTTKPGRLATNHNQTLRRRH